MCRLIQYDIYSFSMWKCAWEHGKKIFTEYGEDTNGHIWTRYTSTPQGYTYDNTTNKDNSSHVRTMTFNIQRVTTETKRNVWDHRPWFSEQRFWRIVDVFKAFTPDIMCLQEIRPGMIDGLHYTLPYKYAFAANHTTPLCYTLPNPIMYNTHRLSLNAVYIFSVDINAFRLIVNVVFIDIYTGKRIYVFNTHQPPYSTQREHAQTECEKEVTILNNKTKPISSAYIILDDFNIDYNTITTKLPHVTSAYTGACYSCVSWGRHYDH